MEEQDQQFLDFIVKILVDHPDDVKIDRTVDEMGVLLTLKVNPEDMGQIIGRDGKTARSLRTLLRVVGAKHNARVNLKIYEPEGSRRAPQSSQAASAPATPAAPAASTPEMDAVDEAVADLKL